MMKFNDHKRIEGTHAFLGASSYHWLNYDAEKLATAYRNHLAKIKGTVLHDFAARCIKLKQKLPKSKKTLNSSIRLKLHIIIYSHLFIILIIHTIKCFVSSINHNILIAIFI